MDAGFPLPFEPLRIIDGSAGGGSGSFLVASLYTTDYAGEAERLRRSCEQFGLPHLIYELPTVHRSISVKGSTDQRFTKPNFIRHLLDRHRKPVLFVDADCVFRARPTLVEDLVADGTTFAIYNWAADRDNEAFYPIDVRLGGRVIEDRYFVFSHRIQWHSTEQLICSGCVQLFDPSPAAAALLARWHATVVDYPGAPDDLCLMFAFNNGGARLGGMRPAWLPKEYARYCWWIYAKPVIDHPQYGATTKGFRNIPPAGGKLSFYPERCVETEPRFAAGSVIDVKDSLLYRFADRRLSLVERLGLEFWIPEGRRSAGTIDVDAIG